MLLLPSLPHYVQDRLLPKKKKKKSAQDLSRGTYRSGLSLRSPLLRRSDCSTGRATATLLVGHPMLDGRFEFRVKVRQMERRLADDGRCLVSRSTAVPAQAIF